ncbi:MAG TPA: hypothetical protein VK766_02830 [Cytophagaceae bacterium]|jgi:hypothetical protein|nr:hypothetical protein [Cytophagaceae bacterium]
MTKTSKHIVKTIESTILIDGDPETIWENITTVNIEQFSDPILFKVFDIPKPLRAEIILEGEGGSRIAYFASGKRFMQKILVWKPLKEYSFEFNPEKGFKVCYLFELSEGVFRIPSGAYFLTTNQNITTLKLRTMYSIDKRLYWIFNLPARVLLMLFQRYLLTSIKKNSERWKA